MRRLVPVLFLPAVACAPQNAELTGGEFTAFMPITTSQTLQQGLVDFDEVEQHYAVDCRRLDEGETAIPGALPICEDSLWPPEHEAWLARDAYQVVHEQLDPWRGEAVMTSEGDFQVTFHHRLPGGADFRFAFVVDPAFEPRRCTQTEDGADVELVDIDGYPWLEKWSEDVESGSLYFLNSGAYQFNPNNTEELWSLPDEWAAGYAAAKFGADNLGFRRVRYGMPSAYSTFETTETALDPAELFYVPMNEGDDPTTTPAYQSEISQVEHVAEETTEELNLVQLDYFTPRVHTNEWRLPDGEPAGLDSWVELHYAWVHFTSDDLAVGGSAAGTFAIVFDAFDSQTRVFVTGEFDVPRIKRDRWVTDDVMAAKLEENGTTLCGLGPDDI